MSKKKKFSSRQKGAVKRLKDYLNNQKCFATDIDEALRDPEIVAAIQEEHRWAVLSVGAPIFDCLTICDEAAARDFVEHNPGSFFQVVDLYSPKGTIEVLFDRQKKYAPK